MSETEKTDHHHRARWLMRRGVLGIHLLQLPLLFGLMLALLVLGFSFFYALFESVVTRDFLDRDKTILLVLDLLDMVFIANLIVMVMVSGYNSYHAATRRGLQRDRMFSYSDEFQPVKSRIAATLVIITGIHLVHEVLAGDMARPTDLLVLGATHLVLLVSAAVFVYTSQFEKRMPPVDQENDLEEDPSDKDEEPRGGKGASDASQ